MAAPKKTAPESSPTGLWTWCRRRNRLVPFDPTNDTPEMFKPAPEPEDDGEPLTEKECTCCGRTLSLDQFYPHKSGRGGVAARCKECMCHQARKYSRTAAGKEARKRAMAKYRKSERGRATLAAARERRKATPGRAISVRTEAMRLGRERARAGKC